MARSDAALNELRARLEKAESERYANGVVYTLAGLLAAALAAAFAFWRRSREAARPSNWWNETPGNGGEPGLAPAGAAVTAEPAVQPVVIAGLPSLEATAGPAQAPSPAEEPSPSSAASAPEGEATRPAARPSRRVSTGMTGFGFLSSTPGTRDSAPTDMEGLRVTDPLPLTADELSDIQQEADFFVSLGEYDRAIEILRNHIEAHPQASAVAWLDLLEIYHKLGQKDEYEQLRRDFEWLFNAHAPSFTEFLENREGLESHPRLMARIQAAWPRHDVLATIDEAIFRRPGTEGEDPMSLESYRDLLFLHSIAAELSADDAVPVAPPASALNSSDSQPAATNLDINLDDLLRAAGLPSAAPAGDDAASPKQAGNVVDFDIDTPSPFKLPGQRPPQS